MAHFVSTAKKKEQQSIEEARKAAEKERNARQAEQAKALEQLRVENEESAIAAVCYLVSKFYLFLSVCLVH